MRSALAVAFLVLTSTVPAGADRIRFEPADLNSDDHLLILAEVVGPAPSSTLIRTDLNDGDRTEILSHPPDVFRYLPGAGELQIQNRFGLFRTSALQGGEVRPVPDLPAFSDGRPLDPAAILPVSASPDGRWVLIQEPAGEITCNLVLHETAGPRRFVLDTARLIEYRKEPAIWSPDSRYLLYESGGRISSLVLSRLLETDLPDADRRDFGPGGLASVRWANPDALIHIDGDDVALVRPGELFARAFYTAPLPVGVSAGRLPFDFDPSADEFWPSPDTGSVLVLRDGRDLYLCRLSADETGKPGSIVQILLNGLQNPLEVRWRPDSGVDVLTVPSDGREEPVLHRLSSPENGPTERKPVPPGTRAMAESPDRRTLAFAADGGISLRDSSTLDEIGFLTCGSPRFVEWIGRERLLIVGEGSITSIRIDGTEERVLTLSSVKNAFFDRDGRIVAECVDGNYVLESASREWLHLDAVGKPGRSAILESGRHRVYTESIGGSPYLNRIRIRRTDGGGNRELWTVPYFPVPAETGSPEVTDRQNELVIGNGSRSNPPRVALTFDLMVDDEGLVEVLGTLNSYGIRSTFFMNGDFLRRNPRSVRLLAESPHEVGSMFFILMDLTDYRYRIDTEFIVRGLDRMEEEYHRATGLEIATFWHAPWYVVSPPILDATVRMGYRYIGGDAVTRTWPDTDGSAGDEAAIAEQLREVLGSVQPGSIIPIRIGMNGNGGGGIFRKIDILINSLQNAGYDVVTVSNLLEIR